MFRFTGLVRKLILDPPALSVRLAISVVVPILFAALRWALDKGALGFPLALHVPVIVACAALFGWQCGLVASVVSMISISLLILPGSTIEPGSATLALLAGLTVASASIILATEALRRLLIALEQQRQDVRLLNRELQHRTKNALQMLISIIERGLRQEDPRPYLEPLPSRLVAWARAIDILRPEANVSCSLQELVASALEAFDSRRVIVPPDDLLIDHAAAAPLIIVLHELATNATKYGALSVPGGKVQISWTVSGEHVELTWRETGGPEVVKPTRRGLGSALMTPRDGLEDMSWLFLPGGVVAQLMLKLPPVGTADKAKGASLHRW